MSDEKPTQSIMPSPVLPLVPAEKAAEQWAAFEALKARLLVDDDYQLISGKRFIRRSGFRKLGVYFGLSNRLVKEERTDREDKSFVWRIVVEVQAPNGRTCIGLGACDSRERSFAHLEHDSYATAFTRALNRAISDMVAGGAVSAEEEAEAPAPTPAPPKPGTWEIPVTKAILGREAGVRQFPLASGTKALGMLNVLKEGYEASLVPEKPIQAEDPAVSRFLIAKVLANMAEAHPGLAYEVARAEDGSLAAIMIRGPLDDPLIKELQGAAAWAFGKALERVTQ